ncbi:MAG: preprotein translocase subunit SecA [Candidatus Midichloriaceae bacterium]|jgi:preprotein translocase subunit SecA|nr:preprotein translocase subunit SecA [Candidatus Midichloriaceae bacterium]
MIKAALRKIFGSSNDRIVRSMQAAISSINAIEAEFKKLSDAELAGKTQEFRNRLAAGETLDDLLVEAFATVREASKRVLGMRHFDVQLVGGIALHRGMIAEMKTGEGKTLVSTLPAYLNALEGKGVHVVTVNDYLATRDSEWMGAIHRFLGLSVGCITNALEEHDRKAAYECDITYGTNNEFGFDYLRDNLKYDPVRFAQKPFNYAIIDEVDSILIDEARTPLIISGPTDDNSDLYIAIDKLIPKLQEGDFELDEKARTCMLTDSGHTSIEQMLKTAKIISAESSLYDLENMAVVHHINQALRAHKLFSIDVDYIVKDGKIMIIDEFTGRIMDGRRYSEGLHQALEAKERVAIQNENQTLASITFQNYFRMYPKLSGMTGTAMTEANEFNDIYKLEVLSIPTNTPVKRKDFDDEIYLSANDKYVAILKEIQAAHSIGQPILVGTTSIEKSELLSSMLKKAKVPHNVLNARYHEQEAMIISQAGRFGAVTIATNMAGRGTDIKLGGNSEMMLKEKLGNSKLSNAQIEKAKLEIDADVSENKNKVLQAGGFYVLGTERHESRRIDNQLRGRSGRQGDPGKTKFYLSMEDDLMRIFGSDKIKSLLSKLGLKEGESIIHPWISKSIEKAQQKVEARNYEIRKNLLRFDDVMNEQRKVIYEQRRYIMTTQDLTDFAFEQIEDVISQIVATHIPASSMPEEWNLEGLVRDANHFCAVHLEAKSLVTTSGITEVEIKEILTKAAHSVFSSKQESYGKAIFEDALKHVFIMTLDALWKDHLYLLDHLRTGIGLRAYAQKDPLNEYKMEAFNMFKHMMDEFTNLSVQRFLHIQITSEIRELSVPKNTFETRNDPAAEDFDVTPKLRASSGAVAPEDRDPLTPATWGKVARNEPCPCGSGKKYKQCHGSL